MCDDDALDLSAWDAPPPPDGIADAVVARMGGTAVGPAMDEEPPSRKRWLVIASSAAAVLVVAVGAWAIVRGREKAPPASGEVVADRAQHVDLGGASADLDRGADIRWRRTNGHLHVEQKAGTAVWRVGEEHVDIAAVAASPATIDAAGARLKVEVPMNLSDARVIGASTVTAAAVAMVTVVVYEGHVNVRRGDQTIVVQPGSTYTVPQPQPPPVVGVAPAVIPSGAAKVAVLGLEGWNGDAVPRDFVDAMRAHVISSDAGPFVLAHDSAKELVDEKLLHDCTGEEPSCMTAIGRDLGADFLLYGSMESNRAGYKVVLTWLDVVHAQPVHQVTTLIPATKAQGAELREQASVIFDQVAGTHILPDAPDETAVQEILAGNTDQLSACVANDVRGTTIRVTISNFGRATSVETERGDGSGRMVASPCISQVIGGLGFPPSKHGGTFTRPLATQSCDVDALIQEGNGYLSVRGDPDAALAKYEAAIACKPELRLYKLAFTAACKVPSAAKARTHWTHLSAEDQRTLLPLCLAQGISRDALEGTVKKKCDVDDLVTQAEGADTRGDYEGSLAFAEMALVCDPSQVDRVAPIAVMAACKGNDGGKALLYLDKVKEPLHSKLAMICAKQGVTSFKAKCDADALAAKGKDYIATGQHAAALAELEKALACTPDDAKLTKLAFMEACNIKNIAKAQRYYTRIPASERGQIAQLCMRQGISPDQLENPLVPSADKGTALITCTPPARILIDGNDTGQTTPATLELAPGKHKLTLQLGGDRFTWPLTIKGGETTTISKDLQ